MPTNTNGTTGTSHARGVQMELSRIVISDLQDQQMIVLHEVDGDRQFPIVIGDPEAKAIDRRLKGILHSRPMTHDLLADVVERMGGTVDRIEIHNLEDHTFFAHVVIRRPTKRDDGHLDTEWLEIDSRPSDAIAVGIATNVPIYVAEHVLAEVG